MEKRQIWKYDSMGKDNVDRNMFDVFDNKPQWAV